MLCIFLISEEVTYSLECFLCVTQANRKTEDDVLKQKYIGPYMKAFEAGMDHFDIAEKVFKVSSKYFVPM